MLWTATIDSSSGDAIVGGARRADSTPVAMVRAANGSWSTALDGYNGTQGAITSSASSSGGFLLAGVTGSADGSGNRSVLVIKCAASPTFCTGATNLAPAADIAHAAPLDTNQPWTVQAPSLSLTTSPMIAVGNDGAGHENLELAYITPGTSSCSTGTKSAGHLKTSALPTISFSDIALVDEKTSGEPNTSCPFSTSAPDRIYTGLAVNSAGRQLWVGGHAPCGYGATGECTGGSVDKGLATAGLPVNGTWRTYFTEMYQLSWPVLKRGYDDTLIGTATQILSLGAGDPLNGGAFVYWYNTGVPGGRAGGFEIPPNGDTCTGVVANGAGHGGSAWAGSSHDLFLSYTRKSGSTISYQFAWLLDSDLQSIVTTAATTSDGIQVLDLAFATLSGGAGAGAVEGWAVGHRITAGVSAPFVAHLK
jgi:hypothetical protein